MHLIKSISVILVLGIILLINTSAKNKKEKEEGYSFTTLKEVKTTSVKDQGATGTCWSYATASFIETEMLRLNKGSHDIAEMYFVRLAYPQKALKYMRYQGRANFDEGGQGHDIFNIIADYGMVPQEVYQGKNYDVSYQTHDELLGTMKSVLDVSLKNMSIYSGFNLDVVDAALDLYLGAVPDTFTYEDKQYTPQQYANEMEIIPGNYIELTSYECYPFYKEVDLEVPDNWSHGLYYNLPIDEMIQIVDNAFDKGFSVNWDGDMSGRGFSHKNGVAMIPEDDPQKMEANERAKFEALPVDKRNDKLFSFDKPIAEKVITPELRQQAFDNFKTTDDHLMHLVGVATDQNGTKYYKTKNSWGDYSNNYGGYLYMSETYLRLKTIAIQVHVDAIPDEIKAKLGL